MSFTHIKSPLRYPGGKSKAVELIIKYFPKNIETVCSPFIGGGSIELALASKGIKVYGYDLFEPLVNFWKVLLKDPKGLAKSVKKYYPLHPISFYKLKKKYFKLKGKKKRAAAFFALNRASFSGLTFSGMSSKCSRFTLPSIKYVHDFTIQNLSVTKADFKSSIAKHKNVFLYLDPPYFNNARLYGINGDLHTNFDHHSLAKILRKRYRWILSYNDCPLIRKLYKSYRILPLCWHYGMNRSRKSNEVLILSNDLKLPINKQFPINQKPLT